MASTEDQNGILPIYKRPKDDNKDPVPKTNATHTAKVDEESVLSVADDAKQDEVKEEMNDAVSNDLDTDEKKVEQSAPPISMVVINPIHQFEPPHISDEIKNLAEKTKINLDSTPPTVTTKDFHVVIYIHGFNNTVENMESTSDTLDKALGSEKLISTSLNWISKHRLIGTVLHPTEPYNADQKCVEKLAPYLKLYLQTIRDDPIFEDKQIDIIAHSMGNHLLCQGIIDAATKKQLHVFDKVNFVCFAADETVEDYKKAIGEVSDIASSWTHYYCTLDEALHISRWVNLTHGPRAGVQNIEVTDSKGNNFVHSIKWDAKILDGINHGYIDDILKNKEMQEEVKHALGLDKD